MSTGRRLAKRSIIGTKVCAPGPDGLWYSGVIQDVKTPPTATITSTSLLSSLSSSSSSCSSTASSSSNGDSSEHYNADTIYIVRFDFKTQTMQQLENNLGGPPPIKTVIMEARRVANAHISPAQTLRRNAMIKEVRESDLIGPGFRSIMGIQLQPGQRVFLTHNGRETSGDVVCHDMQKDEVTVKILAIGMEEPIELKKRLEEVRLLESRRSARLADQDRDTDFARLADMGGDRRKSSHCIEVPHSSSNAAAMATHHTNSRKRRPSYTQDYSTEQCLEDEMNENNAALILMNLSNSPKSPKNAEKWLGSSPGSSSASWSSGSSSPPLSDDGNVHHTTTNAMLHFANNSSRNRTTSVSTSDEGIVVDFKEKRVSAFLPHTTKKWKAIIGKHKTFCCTFPNCNNIEYELDRIKEHVRTVHLFSKHVSHDLNDEEDFYFTEKEDDDDDDDDDEVETPSPTSPPTLSHRDMARPPHEDPEYQRQIVGNYKHGRVANQQHHYSKSMHYMNKQQQQQQTQQQQQQQQQTQQQNHHSGSSSNCMPNNSPLAHHNYTWPLTAAATATATTTTTPQQQQQHHSPGSLIRHARNSHHTTHHHHQRPSQSTAPYPSPNTFVHTPSGSPILHGNSGANNMLQQLSQQNVTVTTHHNNAQQQQQQQQHNYQQQQTQQQQQQYTQLSTVTITPNYHQQTNNANANNQQQRTPATATSITANNNSNSNNMLQQHVAVHSAVTATNRTPNSPNRRTRGENKKCRKVYGMDRRDSWCTQCRWKKACTRFGGA